MLIKLICREQIKPTDKIVVVSTAHGLKFSDFKIRYHESRLEEVDSRLKNLPVEVAADADKVLKILDQKLETLSKKAPA